MTKQSLALPGALVGLVLLHEASLWGLVESDVPSVLFAPGSHSPLSYLVLSVGFIALRLTVYFVVPFVATAWVALSAADALSAVAVRIASADVWRNRTTQRRTFAPAHPPDRPRASPPRSST